MDASYYLFQDEDIEVLNLYFEETSKGTFYKSQELFIKGNYYRLL